MILSFYKGSCGHLMVASNRLPIRGARSEVAKFVHPRKSSCISSMLLYADRSSLSNDVHPLIVNTFNDFKSPSPAISSKHGISHRAKCFNLLSFDIEDQVLPSHPALDMSR
ncbi:hypothetical protein LINGRAHAP2_LOCUS28609 [Linum grandiflorum]